MITFLQHMTEEAVMNAKVGTPTGDRHAATYLNPAMRDKYHYKLSKPLHGLPAKEPVKVHDVVAKDGKYVAHVEHPNLKGRVEVPISNLHKPVHRDIRSKESHYVSDLHDQIINSDHPVYMHDRNGVKHHIVGAHQVPGNPKADIALVNDKGEHVFHISHKASKESHQGYGGMNSKSNTNTPVMKQFRDKLLKHVDNHMMALKGKSKTMKLNHNDPEHAHVIKKALFGTEYSSNKSGPENVDEIHHGKMNLKRNNNGTYGISSEDKITRKNYHSQNYEVVAKHATDRTIPGTNIGGIIGVTHVGHRTGRDVKPLED